jgi:transposase InsO family protein
VEVLKRDVIWGQDGTHVGRGVDEDQAIESQVVRDRGSLTIIGLHTDEAANHEDVIKLLESTASERSGYPLVFSRDNGSIYQHEAVLTHLEKQQVIVLRSLPRTPEHNGATELSIRELKAVAGVGKGCRFEIQHAKNKMAAAAEVLNTNRIRFSKGLKTAVELDEKLPRPEIGQRAQFYKLCRDRMKAALVGQKNVRAGRLAEREEVFRTLEEFGFIKRTRGGNPYVSKSEIFL